MGVRIRSILTETLMWLAAAIGVLCIIFVALAYFMNISLMLFRTGSMEPTIPAGSVAVVQEIAATEVKVGDVLTVDREGRLPVTHRVTSIEAGDDPEERTIRMQGDANDREDLDDYSITEGRQVLFSVPGLAQPINQLNNPWVLGGVTLAASVFVGWAFWPREKLRERSDDDE